MYVKLIVRAGDQRLLMCTKRGTYNCHSFNCAYTASIVKSLKRQTFCKLINFESTHTHTHTHTHIHTHTNMQAIMQTWEHAKKRLLVHFQEEVLKTK